MTENEKALIDACRQAVGYLERKPMLIASAYQVLKAAIKHAESENKK